MPHKHKRNLTDKNTYELPPSQLAKPLSVTKPSKSTPAVRGNGSSSQDHSLKRKRSHKDASKDDTPRAFARLMAFQQGIKTRSGLDDGIAPSKKRKRVKVETEPSTQLGTAEAESTAALRIKPGERFADFGARVDAALPVSGLVGKGTHAKELPGLKKPRTKLERKMQRMYKEWREVDAKRKEKTLEDQEEAEDEDAELGATSTIHRKFKKGRKNKGSDDEDPWAAIAQKRQASNSTAGLVGLHDVVKAPPRFLKAPRSKLRVLDGVGVDVLDVPGKAGSLRRREELGRARRSVVEGYRAMMKERKGEGTT